MGKRVILNALSNCSVNLSNRVVAIRVEHLDDYFKPDTPDEEWIRFVGRNNWIVLTKDKKIRYRTAELQMVIREKVRMFTLTGGNLTGTQMAQLIVNSLSKIVRFVYKHSPPYIVKITSSGNLIPLTLPRLKHMGFFLHRLD
jgi:predicted nuclease of predicted toxin-antitoxin system